MRYKCLVLDHDDTVVKSTPSIHYPSFLEALRVLRPAFEAPTLEAFIGYSFHPGVLTVFRDVLKFDDEEMKIEQEIWRKHTRAVLPEAYGGFDHLLACYRAAGGLICVVSHSESENIKRHYRALFGFEPDMVFGWEMPPEERKPHPYPLDAIMRAHALLPSDLIMVDDLKPGLDMARARGVDFAWAGWSHTAFCVGEDMRKNADYAFDEVSALEEFLMGG